MNKARTAYMIYKLDPSRGGSSPYEVINPRVFLSRDVAIFECAKLGRVEHHIKEVVISDFDIIY